MVSVGSVCLALLLAANQPGKHTPPFDDLTRTVERYDAATIASDTDTLEALVADDYLLVNSDMSVQEKRSFLSDFLMPGFKITGYEMTEPFRRNGDDSALTGGLLKLRWTQDGKDHSRTARIAHFWIKKSGSWRLTYTQLTRAPEAR